MNGCSSSLGTLILCKNPRKLHPIFSVNVNFEIILNGEHQIHLTRSHSKNHYNTMNSGFPCNSDLLLIRFWFETGDLLFERASRAERIKRGFSNFRLSLSTRGLSDLLSHSSNNDLTFIGELTNMNIDLLKWISSSLFSVYNDGAVLAFKFTPLKKELFSWFNPSIASVRGSPSLRSDPRYLST
jgi:hypothetical protein